MRRLNPWAAAALAWIIAAAAVAGGLAIWQMAAGKPFQWEVARDAALMTLPLALVMAWRDRGKR